MDKRLERVANHKYIPWNVVCRHLSLNSSAVNYYLKNICKARLKPLKILANNASGVVGTVPVLYYGLCIYIISTIRSIIDYASPVLVSLPQKSLVCVCVCVCVCARGSVSARVCVCV